MRHRLIHGYAEVRLDLVWEVVQRQLGPLIDALAPLVPDEKAVEAASEAAAAWIDTALDRGMPVPPPSTLEAVKKLRGYKGWAVGLVDLEESLFDDAVERVNITLPRRILRRLDDMARRAGQTRSGLIARLTVTPSPRDEGAAPRRRVRRA